KAEIIVWGDSEGAELAEPPRHILDEFVQAKHLHCDEDSWRLLRGVWFRIIGRHFAILHFYLCSIGGKAFRIGLDCRGANGARGQRITHRGGGNSRQTVAARESGSMGYFVLWNCNFPTHAIPP